MKKITAIIFCIIVFTYNILGVFANELPPSVVDNAGFLTESEVLELTEILNSLRENYAMDVSVVTTSELKDKTAMEFADDYFDYKGYGYGENCDGIMLIVSETPRSYHFSTYARGIDVFNDNAIRYMEKSVVNHLKDDEYYNAFLTFAELSEEILEMESEGEYFEHSPSSKGLGILAALGIPLIIALIITFIQYVKMNDAVSQTTADGYATGTANIRNRQDIYLYSTITKTAKPKNNSTHVSSSGRTHGGRGGSY